MLKHFKYVFKVLQQFSVIIHKFKQLIDAKKFPFTEIGLVIFNVCTYLL
jgi:hypothetical protein